MQEVKLNLYHGEILIGTITKLTTDFPWYIGTIELTAEAEPYKEFFEYELNEEKDSQEIEFDESLLDDWFIEDLADGERFEASFPEFDEDGDIWWRMWPLGTSERVKKELESQ